MKTYLRIGVGIALLAYVFASGMIRWDLLGTALSYPLDILFVQICFLGIVLAQSLRWKVLNGLQKNFIPYRRLLEITMISNFLVLFAPAAVGADVVRGYYSCSEGTAKAGNSIVAIVMDRVLGLMSFFIFTTLFGVLQYQSLSTELRILVASAGFVVAMGVLFFALARWAVDKTVSLLLAVPVLKKRSWWHQCVDGLVICSRAPKMLLRGLGVSLLPTGFSILIFICIGQRMGVSLNWVQYFFVVPLGMVASALTMIPFGLGTGQIAFYQLVGWMGASAEDGATLVTIMQAQAVVFSLLCGFVYLRAGGQKLAKQNQG